jgi:drug/metabolite transporter (DMT)-like permease
LKNELNLSYTVSSLHFSAFALGMIGAGLTGHRVIQKFGRWKALWIAAFGMCGSALLLVAGRGGSFEPDALAVAVLLAIPALIGAANVYRARFLPRGVPGEWLGALTLLSSSVLLAALAFGTASAPLPDGAAALGWLGVQTLALVGGYRLYFILQRRAEPVTFSFMGYVTMATGVAAGTGWFGERLAWTTWPALGLILAALWLVQRGGVAVARLPLQGRA